MSANRSGQQRRPLRLAESVRKQLEPLLQGYGFVCAEERRAAVRFESSLVSVTILQQPLSYELDLVVIRKDQPDRRFSLQDVVEAAQGRQSREPVFFQASTADRMSQYVSSIAQLLQKYGDSMLRGDAATFQRMARVSDDRSHNLTTEVVNAPVRAAAERAWRGKDYRDVTKLYESIHEDLTDLEAKRLEYARRHASDDPASGAE